MKEHKIIAVVGQLVDLYERHMENPNAKTKFLGATAYSLSRITKVSHVTIARYMRECESLGFVDSVVEPYRNTTRTRYFPTQKAVGDWSIWKNTENGQIARSWVASNWMQWYKKQIRKVYRECGMKSPFFRV